MLLVTFAIGLLQEAGDLAGVPVSRFAPLTFHLFVTTM
jgi:hypothetical protein